MDQVVELARAWCVEHAPKGATVEVVREGDRTPVLLVDIPGTVDDTVLLYGHLDKQPEFDGWEDGLGPWEPVMRGQRLYGRGGADDGYAVFASLTAINAIKEQGLPHARCVVLIETCEESGSYDLPYYIDKLGDRLGSPSLVVCLDSGAGNYDQLWCTTSLRGVLVANLTVEVLTEGVHSGDASGIVPSSFRVLRHLLSRLEDPETGTIVPEQLHVEIPTDRAAQATKVADVLGPLVHTCFPFAGETRAVSRDLAGLVLNRTWRPALSVVGGDGLPPVANAGNVLRPKTTVKLSLRLPPTLSTDVAAELLPRLLCEDPPYGSRVTLTDMDAGGGWNAPPVAPWLEEALSRASNSFFGADAVYMGEGGSIPFMGMLGEKFPDAQFMITGVLGPQSNAHGPNEFLDIPTAKKVTASVASVLVDHSQR
jgi:acetylornithine deacetylase/succinyl-diaminopimelate desuccinylase-like protein